MPSAPNLHSDIDSNPHIDAMSPKEANENHGNDVVMGNDYLEDWTNDDEVMKALQDVHMADEEQVDKTMSNVESQPMVDMSTTTPLPLSVAEPHVDSIFR